MTVRVHRYQVDPANVDELLKRRANVVRAIRDAHPGLCEARLIRLEDGTYIDTWRWDSPEEMRAAFASMSSIPEAAVTMSLTLDATAHNGEILDER